MPVLNISLPWTIRQLIISVSFQVHFLHLYSPWAYDAVFVRSLWNPTQKGTASGASARRRFGSKRDLQAGVALALEAMNARDQGCAPGTGNLHILKSVMWIKMKQKKDLWQPFSASPKEHLWPKNWGISSGKLEEKTCRKKMASLIYLHSSPWGNI